MYYHLVLICMCVFSAVCPCHVPFAYKDTGSWRSAWCLWQLRHSINLLYYYIIVSRRVGWGRGQRRECKVFFELTASTFFALFHCNVTSQMKLQNIMKT